MRRALLPSNDPFQVGGPGFHTHSFHVGQDLLGRSLPAAAAGVAGSSVDHSPLRDRRSIVVLASGIRSGSDAQFLVTHRGHARTAHRAAARCPLDEPPVWIASDCGPMIIASGMLESAPRLADARRSQIVRRSPQLRRTARILDMIRCQPEDSSGIWPASAGPIGSIVRAIGIDRRVRHRSAGLDRRIVAGGGGNAPAGGGTAAPAGRAAAPAAGTRAWRSRVIRPTRKLWPRHRTRRLKIASNQTDSSRISLTGL